MTDKLTLEGTTKERILQWKKYLYVRAGVDTTSECNRVAKALGFTELVDYT